MEKDFSKEIFDTWFGSSKVVRITLKNQEKLDGVLVGFYHGDVGESYIEKWDFVPEDKYSKKDMDFEVPESDKTVIYQKDIEHIEFKYPGSNRRNRNNQ